MAEKETAGKKRRLGDMQLFWRRGVQYGEVDLPFSSLSLHCWSWALS